MDYPVDAADLPAKHINALGTMPIAVDIPELDTILGDSKMRGRTKKTNDPAWMTTILATVPAENKQSVRTLLMANCQGLAPADASAEEPTHDLPKTSVADMRSLTPIMRFARPEKANEQRAVHLLRSVARLQTLVLERHHGRRCFLA